jgi:glycine/D-amino acid oxidase-like deaminating enzyme
MTERRLEHVDAVVIGANIRGLVTTYLLSSLGYRAVLLERGRAVGGVDGSFVTPGGTRFERGMHVLDDGRSPAATRLFTRVVDREVHRITLRRAIVLRNRIMPYDPKPSEMPPELRELLSSDELVDDIGSELPTRERLASCYGEGFADLVFDEILPSYPTEDRHREFGVDAALLLTNVYPWFFPHAERREIAGDESRLFHDRLRAGVAQQILYPREGGFGGFAEGFRRKLDPERIEVLLDAGDVRVELEPGTHRVSRVEAKDRLFRAEHYFWAASWPALCKLLSLPCQEVATDRVILGSFRLSRAVETPYHEILVGDPSLRINRLYFPARFRDSDEPLMQIEYAFPKADDRPLEPNWWLDAWLSDLRRLGLVDDRHQVEEYDFKTFCMHFNSFGMEGEPLRDAEASLLRDDSNIRPVVPSMANLNLNIHVPRTIRYVTSVLTGAGGS